MNHTERLDLQTRVDQNGKERNGVLMEIDVGTEKVKEYFQRNLQGKL